MLLSACAACAASAASAARVVAATASAGVPAWPSTTLRLFVAAAPGGVPDVRARWLAKLLSPAIGRPVVVENRAGVGGALALSDGARAPANGSVAIFAHQGVMTITPHLLPQIGYDPLTDFSPVSRFGTGPLLLAVHPDTPARTLTELVQLSKSRVGGLHYATPGIGTPPHLATELLLRSVGMTASHIPYRGGPNAQQGVIAGEVDFQIEGIGLLVANVRAGRLRPLAVTTSQRATLMPEVPTLAEAGAADYEFIGWTGMVMPALTPEPLVQQLASELAKIAQSEQSLEWFAAVGAEPGIQSPEGFGRFIVGEYARNGKLVRDADIRLQ
jgi:tripartite-type tricarboxylate transporter receptor subunit TctC